MLLILILLLLVILIGYASFFVWPNQTLWFLLEWQSRQHYRVHLEGVDYHIDSPALIVTDEPNLKVASLLKRITSLPVYWLTTENEPYSALQRSLMKRLHIKRIQSLSDIPATNPGIILIATANEANFGQTHLPIWLAFLCGKSAAMPTRRGMRFTPRDLQLSLRSYTEKKEPLAEAMQRLSVSAWEHYVDHLPSIVEAWLDQAKSLGHRLAVADSTGVKLTHHRLIVAVLSLRSKLFTRLAGEQRIGICLPTSVGAVTTLLSLLSLGKTLVSLNYTASQTALKAAIHESGLKQVITSRRFLETLAKRGLPLDTAFEGREIILLEDLRREMTQKELFKNYCLVRLLPTAILKAILVNPMGSHHVATILFSSGSEDRPKGIELTHRNIVGNAKQAAEALEAKANDVMLGILPIFHAFGLTATTLLPLIEGITLVCHPDPTDTAAIGELALQYKATILCGTSTFFRLYCRAQNLTPACFASLRIIVAGAERLSPEVRVLFEEKFKKQIFEGYGTTELSPVSNTNRPDTRFEIRNKMGTVGKTIPGCMVRILDPETGNDLPVGEAGLIAIGGVNVMKGYLNDPHKTNQVFIHQHGIRWYKTGDKGRLDAEGFLTVLDRYSRFAKIGGEMVSLGAIETQINLLISADEVEIVIVALPDAKKGEKLILLYTGPLLPEKMGEIIKKCALPNLMKPSEHYFVDALPKLGSGKVDFAAAKILALDKIEAIRA